jgi:hypothetical protein
MRSQNSWRLWSSSHVKRVNWVTNLKSMNVLMTTHAKGIVIVVETFNVYLLFQEYLMGFVEGNVFVTVYSSYTIQSITFIEWSRLWMETCSCVVRSLCLAWTQHARSFYPFCSWMSARFSSVRRLHLCFVMFESPLNSKKNTCLSLLNGRTPTFSMSW